MPAEHPPDGEYQGLATLHLRHPIRCPHHGQTMQIYGHIVIRWPQYHVYRTQHQATHVNKPALVIVSFRDVVDCVAGIDRELFCGFDAVKYRAARRETKQQRDRRLLAEQQLPRLPQYKWCRRGIHESFQPE